MPILSKQLIADALAVDKEEVANYLFQPIYCDPKLGNMCETCLETLEEHKNAMDITRVDSYILGAVNRELNKLTYTPKQKLTPDSEVRSNTWLDSLNL